MAKTKQTRKEFSQHSITTVSSLKNNLILPPGHIGHITTPTKDVKNGAIITPNKYPKEK